MDQGYGFAPALLREEGGATRPIQVVELNGRVSDRIILGPGFYALSAERAEGGLPIYVYQGNVAELLAAEMYFPVQVN